VASSSGVQVRFCCVLYGSVVLRWQTGVKTFVVPRIAVVKGAIISDYLFPFSS
jgi:hypothetical protein